MNASKESGSTVPPFAGIDPSARFIAVLRLDLVKREDGEKEPCRDRSYMEPEPVSSSTGLPPERTLRMRAIVSTRP